MAENVPNLAKDIKFSGKSLSESFTPQILKVHTSRHSGQLKFVCVCVCVLEVVRKDALPILIGKKNS